MPVRDVRELRLPGVGGVVKDAEPDVPFTITDAAGQPVDAVSEFIRDLFAGDASVWTCRSYAYDLLRWWRFLHAVGVDWDRAQRTDVRDLVLWSRQAENPQRARSRPDTPAPGSVNRRTGKRYLDAGYAPVSIDHQLAVLAGFYDFHASMGRGPVVNPVPATRDRRDEARRGPMFEAPRRRRSPYRQKRQDRVPRGIDDELWDELFAAMTCNRDRAILATYVSSGVRASELLGMTCGDLDFGRQTITVVRKGSRARKIVPASADAFVWIRLYLAEGLVCPPGQPLPLDAPLWVTLRRPIRPLDYTAMRAVMRRANAKLGTNFSLHDLRHTSAQRMVDDGQLSLTDIQQVLGHKSLSATQVYTTVKLDTLITRMREHHQRRALAPPARPHPDYDRADLAALFGETPG